MSGSWQIKPLGEFIEIRNGRNQQGVLSINGIWMDLIPAPDRSTGDLMSFTAGWSVTKHRIRLIIIPKPDFTTGN